MSSFLRLLGVVLAPVLAFITLTRLGPVTGAGTFAGLLLVGLLTGALIRSWWSTAYAVALGMVWVIYTIVTYTGTGEITLPVMIFAEILVAMLPGTIGAAIGTVLGQWIERRWNRSHTGGTA